MPEIRVSKNIKDVVVVGDDVVYLSKLKKTEEGSLKADVGHSDVFFHHNGASVVKYVGEHSPHHVVSVAHCIGERYIVYRHGPDRPELFPIAVRIDEEGKARFGVIPKDELQHPKVEHDAIKPHIALAGVTLDRNGFFDVRGAEHLLKLLNEGNESIKDWEIALKDPKEAEKRLKLTLQAIIHDHREIANDAKYASQFWEIANRAYVREMMPESKSVKGWEMG